MVTLTVTDQEGAEDTMTIKVKIAGPSAPGKDGIGPTGNLLVIAAIAILIVAILAVLMMNYRFRPRKRGKG